MRESRKKYYSYVIRYIGVCRVLPIMAITAAIFAFTGYEYRLPLIASAYSATDEPKDQPSARSQLDSISQKLKAMLSEGEKIAAKLGSETRARDASKLAGEADQTLSGIADQTATGSAIIRQIAAIRTRAIAYRQEVMEMPPETMTEDDRRRVINAWTRLIETATKAEAAVSDIHNSVVAELGSLRKRQVAFSQLITAGEEQVPLDEVIKWTQ